MKKVFSKLSAKRGASIVLALLIFMMCAFAGVTAFAMSAANAGRYAHASRDYQPYHSVISAAVLMRDVMDGATFTSKTVDYSWVRKWSFDEATETRTESDDYTLGYLAEPAQSTVAGATASGKKFDGSSMFAAIASQCDKLVEYVNVRSDWYDMVAAAGNMTTLSNQMPATVMHEFSLTSSEVPTIGNVKIKLIMASTYDLLFVFTFGDDSSYSASLYLEADVVPDVKPGDYKFDVSADGKSGSQTIPTTLSVKVTWSAAKATISRGEATIS